MPSTVTTPVAARIPNELVEPFRQQAQRFGLTPSRAVAALIEGALLVEGHRPDGGAPEDRG